MSISKAAFTDEERDRLWDDFVEKIVRVIVPEQYDLAQGLGKMDADILRQEKVLPLIPSARDARGHAHEEQILRSQATLWVLGMYEIVRLLDRRLNPQSGPILVPEAKDLKRIIERVRVPLAKVERAARASAPEDIGIGVALRLPTGECGWLLGEGTVTRVELANAVLEFRPNLENARRGSN